MQPHACMHIFRNLETMICMATPYMQLKLDSVKFLHSFLIDLIPKYMCVYIYICIVLGICENLA